ncbi:MAG: asparagine synthase (glutamine-hydrolyzing) [Bacteroidota bacterium]
MCGITGFYSPSGKFNEDGLHRMTDVIAHRGPDAAGYFMEGPVGLGHRRLSIIDLSASANQPMLSHDERYAMVFNGEIYNYMEIVPDLRASRPSLQLKTTSDTEVILEAFIEWGPQFVHKMNGMFAIAIYDRKEKNLHVFRDRMGIKPIYYFLDGNNFAFASELKALVQLPYVKQSLNINKRAINEFLHLGYIPGPDSIYSSISKFPSGSYGVMSGEGLKIENFWNPDDKIKKEIITDEVQAKEMLHNLIVSSAKYRLISDVPYGTFLSGGIDSSVVTAAAQSVSSAPLNTFSIGFGESKYDESGYARKVAEHLGTKHHEFTVSEKDAMELIPELYSVYDEPYADSSAVPTMLVSKLARQHVTMTLSGDGGDELFSGYGAYRWAERLSSPLYKTFRKPLAAVMSLRDDRYRRAAKVLQYPSFETLKSHVFSQEQNMFTRSEIQNILEPGFVCPFTLHENFSGLNRTLSAPEAQALFDIHHYLKDDLLVKVDRATMKYSLETRVPLLDYRIVEFALNLSHDLKYLNGTMKYLLKQVLYDFLPAALFARPKWGFSIPLSRWLGGELKYLQDEFLSDDIIKKHGVINVSAVHELKRLYNEKGHEHLYNRLWLLIVLHQFLENKD